MIRDQTQVVHFTFPPKKFFSVDTYEHRKRKRGKMFFPSHSKFRQSSRRLLPTMKSEVRNDMTTSGNLQILGHRNNFAWNPVWVELAQNEFYVGKNEYPSERIERLYTLGYRSFVVVLDCSPAKRGLNAHTDNCVPRPHNNKVSLVFMATKSSDYLKWITKISKHVSVVRSKKESHVWRSKFMTRKTIRRDNALEMFKMNQKKSKSSRPRKSTNSSSSPVGESGERTRDSPDYNSGSSPELSPAKLILEKTHLRAESLRSNMSLDSPGPDSNTSTNGWIFSTMSMFGDWIIVESVTNTEDEDYSYVSYKHSLVAEEKKSHLQFKFRYERKKSADVILLSSIRSVHRYEGEDGMINSSLVLTHECPRNDGRLVMYEFRAAPGMKALDHTIAWQGLLSCFTPRILNGGMPFRDLVVRVGSKILTGWLYRRVDGMLRNEWKRQWVVLDGNDRTLKCFESTAMRNCTFALCLGKGM